MNSLITESVAFVKVPRWLFGKSTPDEKAVIGALQYHFPNIEPSLARIADLSGVSRSGVLRIIQSLEGKGWITVFRSPKGKGKPCRNKYILNVFDEKLVNPNGVRVKPIEKRKPPERATQQCQGGTINGVRVEPFNGVRVTLKVDQSKLEQITRKDLEPPFVPPVGERRAERDDVHPYRDQGEFFHNPDPEPQATAIDPNPSAAQPQPNQPVKPWQSQPSQPSPQPQTPPEPRTSLAHVPVNPPNQKRKAGFTPTAEDVPAALLPVVSELLKFWASKGGKRTERAWSAQLGQLARVQQDPSGGTESVRAQLVAGAQAAIFGKPWQAVTYVNWQRYGRTTPISGTGFNRRMTQDDHAAEALAFIKARDARRAAEAAQQAQQLVEVA